MAEWTEKYLILSLAHRRNVIPYIYIYIYLKIIMHFLNETLARWRPDKGAEIRRKEL